MSSLDLPSAHASRDLLSVYKGYTGWFVRLIGLSLAFGMVLKNWLRAKLGTLSTGLAITIHTC